MKLQLFQIDAFTDKVFGGNPAAVCPLEKWLKPELLQKIAAENNLPETAFFVKNSYGLDIRWFTPEMEINLCGHATLASAHVLFNHLGYNKNQIIFDSKSGTLKVTKKGEILCLDFPSNKPEKISHSAKLEEALGAKPIEVYKSRDILAIFENEKEIEKINPNFELLKQIDCMGVIVSAKGKNCDFVSRFFAPKVGINEDPVTGSAHTTLVPYWAEKLEKKKLHAFQISKRRGELFCEIMGRRVLISGKAVTYLIGEISI
ncbi:MAG: PhzF family phenazine biosynthesis protein [Bacteroidales bacterium]|nr:PhzF family phenazine biosynthesis protein [Bacteroidales bacterium]